jgi:hypothetical protein
MAGLIWPLMQWVSLSVRMQAVVWGLVALGLYLMLAWLLKSPELAALPQMLRRR